jgi:uncharacterized protein (DUF983 family)
MARGQANGTTILLGLEGYKVGEVWGREEKVVVKTEVKGRMKCPHCGSGKLYGHGMCKPREILYLDFPPQVHVDWFAILVVFGIFLMVE